MQIKILLFNWQSQWDKTGFILAVSINKIPRKASVYYFPFLFNQSNLSSTFFFFSLIFNFFFFGLFVCLLFVGFFSVLFLRGFFCVCCCCFFVWVFFFLFAFSKLLTYLLQLDHCWNSGSQRKASCHPASLNEAFFPSQGVIFCATFSCRTSGKDKPVYKQHMRKEKIFNVCAQNL